MSTLSLDGYQYAQAFRSLQAIDLESLDDVTDKACALPFLTKMLLNPFFARRKKVLEIVYKLSGANDMVQLLQTKPLELQELTTGLESIKDSDFEAGSPRERLKIVALEYIRLYELTRSQQPNAGTTQQQSNNSSQKLHRSNIFDNPLYLDHVSLCLYTLLNRAISIPVINLLDLVETLLHVKQGPVLILNLVINIPDRCQEVCQSLISLGDSLDEGAGVNEISENRVSTLRAICRLNSMMIFKVRALSIQLRLVPSITIVLSLDQLSCALAKLGTPDEDDKKSPADLLQLTQGLESSYESSITFVIGILQDEQDATRTWFARYIKTAQQKRAEDSILLEFRSQLTLAIKRLLAVFYEEDIAESVKDFKLDESETDEKFLNRKLIQATATLRYFASLRGIGMLKINPDESECLLSLITSKPPKDETSVNFITVAICTLFVCSSIISGHKEERRAGDWLRWVLKEFGDESICDLLNTIAKHFQTNQINQISELICSTLGMRLQIKAFISKCKQLILQDAFNYKTSPVYPEQETEKRKPQAKYQAPIKDWIYKKISEHDEALRVEMVGITPRSISHDQVDELKRELAAGFGAMRRDPVGLLRVVNKILQLPREDIWTFTEIYIQNWFGILDLDASIECKKLVKALTKLWWRLNTIQPRELWVMTINSLHRSQPLRPSAEMEYTWDDLACDPLIVLNCDIRVFRTNRLLDIVLHILTAFLETSKQCLQDQVDEMPSGPNKDNRSFEELKSTLVLAQTSAAIQILMEHCLPDGDERVALDKKENNSDLIDKEVILLQTYGESVDCICQHLHQVFIADTNLAKLVHFQTYPSDLLAITTDKVPSMHICLDFIPELLSQPDLPKQVFVIQLTSHLCEKYAITKSLNCAKLCFNAAFTLMQFLPSDKRAMFYVPALPALLRICIVFPILQEDARLILNQVYQVTLAHMASTPSRLSLSATNPFEGLDKLSWNEVKRLMRGLSLDEALFLCTQKCLIDLEQMEMKDKQNHHDQSTMMIENSQRPAYNTIFAYGSHVMNPTY